MTTAGIFSPVENEPPLRWLRWLHLAPASGLGTARRALFFMAVTWLPIVGWAAIEGRPTLIGTDESLLQHYGIHVRCLVAIPLFIVAEAWAIIVRPTAHDDGLAWAFAPDGTLGFGGWWFAYVARPVFIALLLGWIWRIVLVTYWMWRIGRLGLSLVPTHPDHAGGLGFVEKLPAALAPVTFAISAAIASRWAHEMNFHGATLQSFRLPLALFVILWSLFALLPLLALAPAMRRARTEALPAYAALVGQQGRLVHRRWILHEDVGEAPILDASQIGPVADAGTMYDAVKSMRIVPIGRASIVRILLPLALPMLAVAATQVPIADIVTTLGKALL